MKKMLLLTTVVTVFAGIVMVTAGTWGIVFTYQNVARENITTPDDASIPEAPVRGPFTLKAQSDVIRFHTLSRTDNMTYAELPRQIPQVDENNEPVLGEDGKPVMISNPARDMWMTANTLTTALNLGVLTYAFCAFSLALGVVLILVGLSLHSLAKNYARA